MSRILVMGSANMDLIMSVPRLPTPGETVTDGVFMKAVGGKGANQAVAARRAGAEVRFVGCLGCDDHGDTVLAALAAEGIDVSGMVRTRQVATGVALVLVDQAGENYIAVAPGSNYALTAEVVETALAAEDIAMLLLQCEIAEPALQSALDHAQARGIPVLFNYAPARPLSARLQASQNVGLVVNELEAAALAGVAVLDVEDATSAAQKLLGEGYGFVVVTLGAQGACVVTAQRQFHVEACAVRSTDTTAAGDTSCGVLGAALAEGQPLEAAAQVATVAASLCVQRAGAQPSIPLRSEVEAIRQRPAIREFAAGSYGAPQG